MAFPKQDHQVSGGVLMDMEKHPMVSFGATVVNPSGRIIIVGDIHGCYEEVLALLEKCKASAKDVVIMLGDLIDRGPDSGKCVDLALRIEARQSKPACILGNHENKHLDHEDIRIRLGRLPSQMPPTHVVTRSQLRPEHYDYFRRMPLFIRLPEHNAVAVHAGVFPGREIGHQSSRHLLHIQMINPFDNWGNPHQGTDAKKSMWPSRIPPGEEGKWKFWTHFWAGPERVFFGHSVLNKPLIRDKFVGIDGGACFGLALWAYVLPDNELVEVKARAAHGPRDRKIFLIHDDVGTY